MRYLILFLLAGSVMAEDFVVEPIQYDIPPSKWVPAARWYTAGKCTDPMNLFEVCPSKGALLFNQKVAEYKKKVALAAAEKAKAVAKVKAKATKSVPKHA